jgi:hypothetical protein
MVDMVDNMEQNKQTPIEQWIEKNRERSWPKQKGLTATASNKSMAKKVAYTKGCKELLTYLGLDIPDPKKRIETYAKMQVDYSLLEQEARRLQAENELLKKVLKGTDDALSCINWEGEEPIRLKLEAENEIMKKALMKIYLLDIKYTESVSAVIMLREIAEQAHPDLKGGKQ